MKRTSNSGGCTTVDWKAVMDDGELNAANLRGVTRAVDEYFRKKGILPMTGDYRRRLMRRTKQT